MDPENFAFPPCTVDSRTFYDRLGPQNYEMIVSELDWQGPRDMIAMLEDVYLEGAVIADFAIGTGTLSEAFRHAGAHRIIGIDSAPAYLDYCMKTGRADEIHVCDLTRQSTPLPDASIDVSTCSGLFSYLTNPNVLIWELTRVTRHGGYIAVNFHPGYYSGQREMLPATSVRPGGQLCIERHSPFAIRDVFQQTGATLVAESENPAAILRFETQSKVPLITQLYRKCGPLGSFSVL